MILWHAGVGALLTYVTLGRRRIDYRYVLLGALLPDLVDAMLGFSGVHLSGGRGPGHSLLMVVAVGVTIVIGLSGARRLSVFGIAVGWLTHLALDGMWEAPRIFLWPVFGLQPVAGVSETYSWDVLAHPLDHLWTWAGEVVGALVLAWFWVAHRLGERDRLRAFLKDGYLRP